ncbi:MAG TPA: DUF5320 domain-containing protein, partial [Candidatus Polarisedimenticolia bacterium]|nr:DUF5320 domain-containing protein [Candidatus Polarisedimenticolia bacterium]
MIAGFLILLLAAGAGGAYAAEQQTEGTRSKAEAPPSQDPTLEALKQQVELLKKQLEAVQQQLQALLAQQEEAKQAAERERLKAAAA